MSGFDHSRAIEKAQLNPEPAMLIAGELCGAASGARFATADPTTEETLAQVPLAGAEDVARAVTAARAAFDSGMNAHLGKPIRLGDLLRTLGTLRAGAPPAVVGPGGDVSEALLDEAMLAQLELLPREALRHVLELFVDAAEEHTQAMQEAMARGDLAAIGASAHALRGTAGSLGASALSRLCGDLELCCQDGRSARAAELLDMAPRDVSRAVSALRARLG